MPVHGFAGRIVVDALGPRIPRGNAPLAVQQVECVVLHPRRKRVCRSWLTLRRLIAEYQHITDRQYTPFGHVLYVLRSGVGTHQPERTSLFPLFLQGLPKLRYLGFDARVYEFIHRVTNDFLARLSQELAGSSAGVPGSALIVGNQDGRRGVIDDCAEKQLELFGTIFDEPVVGVRGEGGWGLQGVRSLRR